MNLASWIVLSIIIVIVAIVLTVIVKSKPTGCSCCNKTGCTICKNLKKIVNE